MKLSGTVAFRDVVTGVWVLQGDDGRTYQLSGGDRGLKKDGSRVELEGEVEHVPTAAMIGPVFRVMRYRFL